MGEKCAPFLTFRLRRWHGYILSDRWPFRGDGTAFPWNGPPKAVFSTNGQLNYMFGNREYALETG
jgi:hypothetical protein